MKRTAPHALPAIWTLALFGVLVMGLTPANAICTSPRLFRSSAYIYTPGVEVSESVMQSSITENFTAHFWALGFGDPELRRGIDNGAFGPEFEGGWIWVPPGYPAAFNFGSWAASVEIDGCIDAAGSSSGYDGSECMVVLFADQHDSSGYFALLAELPNPLLNFYFAPSHGEHYYLAALPAPQVSSIQHSGAGDLKLIVASPDVTSGLHVSPGCARQADLVLGYRVYQQRLEPGELPAEDRSVDAGWSGGSARGECGEPLFFEIGESADLSVACDQDTDVYLALSLVFDSGFETPVVSAESDVVRCRVCPAGSDNDGDGYCAGLAGSAPSDCDDDNAAVFPGAFQKCDGINNDCLDPAWPAIPPTEIDTDDDGFASCNKTVVIELPADNCPGVANPDQADADGDGIGDACDPDPGGRQCKGRSRDC